MNNVELILSVATSKDGFIADKYGNGDFSSPEDKAQFRAFLKTCDGFVCGRKTADAFAERLMFRPLFVLSKGPRINPHYIYISSLEEFYEELQKRDLHKIALLGGKETYDYFLERSCVTSIRLTTEGCSLFEGLSLNLESYLKDFTPPQIKRLSAQTTFSSFQRKF